MLRRGARAQAAGAHRATLISQSSASAKCERSPVMRHFVILITVMLAWLATAASSPIDMQRRLVNHPRPDQETRVRLRRSDYYVKGGHAGTKTQSAPAPVPTLRKGEYLCGNKVCKLRPGERPPCEHCQYPV